MASNHKELVVWQKSYQLCLNVYILCKSLPKNEYHGLISQMQRSAVSIPSNIAEGHQRNSSKEFKHFLGIAKGSAAELETQLLLARDVYGLSINEEIVLVDEIQRMIQVLKSKL